MNNIWKTITTERTPNLEGIKISSYAKDMLSKINFPNQSEPIDLVKISVRELGFTDWAPLKDIYEKAKEHGWELCPPEVGPILRDEYRNQPLGEWLWIAMEPIADQGGDPYVFGLGRSGDGLWLSDDWARPTYEWLPDDEFVFRLRKLFKPLKSFASVPDLSGTLVTLKFGGIEYEAELKRK